MSQFSIETCEGMINSLQAKSMKSSRFLCFSIYRLFECRCSTTNYPISKTISFKMNHIKSNKKSWLLIMHLINWFNKPVMNYFIKSNRNWMQTFIISFMILTSAKNWSSLFILLSDFMKRIILLLSLLLIICWEQKIYSHSPSNETIITH